MRLALIYQRDIYEEIVILTANFPQRREQGSSGTSDVRSLACRIIHTIVNRTAENVSDSPFSLLGAREHGWHNTALLVTL